MRILHTEASNGWGGQEIRILSEALWFRDNGHEVVLAGPSNGRLKKNAKKHGFTWHDIPFTKKSQFKDYFKLRSLLKKEEFDVIATHSSVDSWVGILAGRSAKISRIVRYRHVSTPVSNNKRNRWQYRSGCDFVVTTADCIKQMLQNRLNCPSEKIASIPTGIKAPTPLPDRTESHTRLAKECSAPEDSQWIGQVSVLRSWKGHLDLIDAFDILAPSYDKLRLALAGDGPYREVLEERAAKSPHASRIHFLGQQDPWWFFRALDVAILASTKNEGVPQSLMQAMFAETPVVGTDVGGIPEIVSHRDTGLVAPPENPVTLAQNIEIMLADESMKRHCVDNATKRAQQMFTLDIMGKRIEEIMQSR